MNKVKLYLIKNKIIVYMKFINPTAFIISLTIGLFLVFDELDHQDHNQLINL